MMRKNCRGQSHGGTREGLNSPYECVLWCPYA